MNIFAYGSLMFEQVWAVVARGSYETTNARLSGYQRRKIRGETYPALFPGSIDDFVDGIIYLDVDAIDSNRLDQFEGKYYTKALETFTLPDNRKLSAHVYVFKPEFNALVEEEPWNPEWFKKVGIHKFISAYAGYGWIDPTFCGKTP